MTIPPPRPRTTLAPGCQATGDWHLDHDLTLQGRFAGLLQCKTEVDLVAGSLFEGVLQAQQVRVAGVLRGTVLALGRIEILAGGQVEGAIYAPDITLAPGAVVHAQVQTGPAAVAAGKQAVIQAIAHAVTPVPVEQPRPHRVDAAVTTAEPTARLANHQVLELDELSRTEIVWPVEDEVGVPAEPVFATATPVAPSATAAATSSLPPVTVGERPMTTTTVPASIRAILQRRRPVAAGVSQ